MREGSRSQAFLSLFTTSDRAVSIVGDLLEESRSRVRTWYALKVVGIALAMCLRTIRSAPVRCLSVGATGTLVYLSVWSVVFVASGLPWYPWNRIEAPGFWIRLLVVGFIANLLTGFILGRWVSYKGINALVPLFLLYLIAWPADLIFGKLFFWNVLQVFPLALLVLGAIAYPLFGLVPLLVGATLARLGSRAVRPTT
jgi:hypothetical protein